MGHVWIVAIIHIQVNGFLAPLIDLEAPIPVLMGEATKHSLAASKHTCNSGFWARNGNEKSSKPSNSLPINQLKVAAQGLENCFVDFGAPG